MELESDLTDKGEPPEEQGDRDERVYGGREGGGREGEGGGWSSSQNVYTPTGACGS